MNKQRSKSRRGAALVQMLTVIVITSAALGMMGLTLHVLWRVEDRRRNAAAAADSVSRLSVQLRADAHQAARVAPVEAKKESDQELAAGVAFELSGERRVVYQPGLHFVQRTEFEQEEVRHRDTFRLAKPQRAAFEIPTDEKPNRVILAISQPYEPQGEPSVEKIQMRIETAVALHGEDRP